MDGEINTRIFDFKKDLKTLDVPLIVQKHITYGDCFVLDQNLYFQLKHEVSRKFNLHPSQVQMVGSGKLGFSIVWKKRYRSFGDTSDIDLAIICPSLFDQIWREAYNYQKSGSYWPQLVDFQRYLFNGWIRPDKFPPEKSFDFCKIWWDFFNEITSVGNFGPYHIKAGLYKSWFYLESYQSNCVKDCKTEVENENNSH